LEVAKNNQKGIEVDLNDAQGKVGLAKKQLTRPKVIHGYF